MTEHDYRTETDGMGRVDVPVQALYAAQTQRAVNNFAISELRFPPRFISAIAEIKKAAAQVNADLGLLPAESCEAIASAADEIIQNLHTEQFPVDVFQTGSGTSTNMNVNEVIVGLCRARYGLELHSNDHVNLGQSSNDVIPTAIQLSTLLDLEQRLLPAFRQLITSINDRATDLDHTVKTERTHLMDATPISFGQELSGWSSQLEFGMRRLEELVPSLLALPQGGTAVGTGINTHPTFAKRFAQQLSDNLQATSKCEFSVSTNFFRSISSQDLSVSLSGHLKVLATSLYKITTDLRWMNSGPLSGLAEINLEALQPGSSIMPGKVNPVIPEAVSMACAQVVGNDATITLAALSGNFQLNVMLPVIAFNQLQSIELLSNSALHLSELCIKRMTINTSGIEQSLRANPVLSTALAPIIGYEAAAIIAKTAYETGRPLLDITREATNLDEVQIQELLDPYNLIGR